MLEAVHMLLLDDFAPNRLPGNVTLGLAVLSQPPSCTRRHDGDVADTIVTRFYPLPKAMGTGRALTQKSVTDEIIQIKLKLHRSIMLPEISEFSYGFALMNELVGWTELSAAPVFPSLIEEGKAGGGYDVKLDWPGAPLYLQFKRSEQMTLKDDQRPLRQKLPELVGSLRSAQHTARHRILQKQREAAQQIAKDQAMPKVPGTVSVEQGPRFPWTTDYLTVTPEPSPPATREAKALRPELRALREAADVAAQEFDVQLVIVQPTQE